MATVPSPHGKIEEKKKRNKPKGCYSSLGSVDVDPRIFPAACPSNLPPVELQLIVLTVILISPYQEHVLLHSRTYPSPLSRPPRIAKPANFWTI